MGHYITHPPYLCKWRWIVTLFICIICSNFKCIADWKYYNNNYHLVRDGHCTISIPSGLIYSSDSYSSSSSSSFNDNDDGSTNSTIWVFGGTDIDSKFYSSILYIHSLGGEFHTLSNITSNNTIHNNSSSSSSNPSDDTEVVSLYSRWGHSCTYVDRYTIYIYGGNSNPNKTHNVNDINPLGDLWSYNITTGKFKLLTNYTDDLSSSTVNETVPIPRHQHSVSSNSTYLFLFGGLTNNTNLNETNVLGDFWMYNVVNGTWILLNGNHDGDNSTNTTTIYKYGYYNDTHDSFSVFYGPSPRYGHSSEYTRQTLIIFGGTDSNGNQLNDLWSYSLETNQWTLLSLDPPVPPRTGHMMELDGSKEHALIIFGGYNQEDGTLSDMYLYLFDSIDNDPWRNLGDNDAVDPVGWQSFPTMTYRPDLNGFIVFGGLNNPSKISFYDLDCDCNEKGGCFYGECNCFTGYYGEYCEKSIDGPLLLGLGIAISVPILCFGWCVLRCTPLSTRIKILSSLIVISSGLLFISIKSCLSCWIAVCVAGSVTGLISFYGILFTKNHTIIFVCIVCTVLSIGSGIYGLAEFLPYCNTTCKNDSPENKWLPKFAILMGFIEESFLILVLPLLIKLYRHRKLINRIYQGPMNHLYLKGGELTGLVPLMKKLEGSPIGAEKESNSEKAINYLQKEHHLRMELNKQRIAKLSGGIRIVIDRNRVFKDSYAQLSQLPIDQLVQNLNIKFMDEEGVDMGGLKKEWFSLLFKEMFDVNTGLFIYNSNYTLSINPQSSVNSDHLAHFYFAGKMVAKSVSEGVHLDHTFSRTIYKMLLGRPTHIDDLLHVDPEFYKSLMWILDNSVDEMEEITFSTTIAVPSDKPVTITVEDSSNSNDNNTTTTTTTTTTTSNNQQQDYTPKTQLFDLKPGGRDIVVTDDNKEEFVKLMADYRFKRDISDQVYHFVLGFREIIPIDLLQHFNECELELFVCGLVEIDIADWKANTTYRGYSPNSVIIDWFWKVVEEMEMEDRIRLFQFVTGNTRLPAGGFNALDGEGSSIKFQIHKSYAPDNQLPVARTCFNRLDLPNYTSFEALKKAILIAIHEGLPYFGLA